MSKPTHVTIEQLVVPPNPGLLLRRIPATPGRFVLESQAGPAALCRYSFLGYDPFIRLRCDGNDYRLTTPHGVVTGAAEPLALLDELLSRYAVAPQPGLPPFIGGAVGYFAYDLIRPWHRVPTDNEQRPSARWPDVCLDFYDVVVVVDHAEQAVFLVSCPYGDDPAATERRRAQLRDLLTRAEPPATAAAPSGQQVSVPPAPRGSITSNFTAEAFIAAVQIAQRYIATGSVDQLNLSHRLATALPTDVATLWHQLRATGGSPFGAYLDYGDFQILSASPERYLQIQPVLTPSGTAAGLRTIQTRPIKGTRPRGRTVAEDAAQAQALLASERERAELGLVTDMCQAELKGVCLPGTVTVAAPRQLETYPGVHHTAAVVEGQLRPDVTLGQLLRATFPPASIAGVPRAAALELIAALETVPRGLYTGALGYVSVDGHVDLSVLIRALLVRDGTVFLHVGSGIVADADAAAEYDETLHKATTLLRALGCAVPQTVVRR